MNEPILEPFARAARFSQILAWIPRHARVVDFGCGPEAPLYSALLRTGKNIRSYRGLDPLTTGRQLGKNAEIVTQKFEQFSSQQSRADVVTLAAVLEHVDDALECLKAAYQTLRPGGVIVLTTPTPLAKPILEFLSFRLNIISRREIEEHKRYLRPQELHTLLEQAGFHKVKTSTFELGLNNLAVAQKPYRVMRTRVACAGSCNMCSSS